MTKTNPMFLKNNAYVCENCFLRITKHNIVAGNTLDYLSLKHG